MEWSGSGWLDLPEQRTAARLMAGHTQTGPIDVGRMVFRDIGSHSTPGYPRLRVGVRA